MIRCLLICSLSCALWAAPEQHTLVDFANETLPDWVRFNHTEGRYIPHEDGHAWQIDYAIADWPNLLFQAPEAGWDWRAYDGLAIDLYNPTEEAIAVTIRLDNPGADGVNHCNNLAGLAPPKANTLLQLRFKNDSPPVLWGMRGTPLMAPTPTGDTLDLSRISAFQIYIGRPKKAHRLIVKRAFLFKGESASGETLAMPFINRFGQYMHADWPGKLKEEAGLRQRAQAEAAAWKAQPHLPGRDRFGGWADGPQREATGWFRTEEIAGKWWLITPEGHLFFSLGLDCVGTWNKTFVEGREDWFEWLPKQDEAPFNGLYQKVGKAHSMAEPINGEGLSFGFYSANLMRKYGDTWAEQWHASIAPRLRHWGFNTLGNWTQHTLLGSIGVPYVTSTGLGGVKEIDGATGYWAKMMDVYDPSFTKIVEERVTRMTAAHAENPLCIGYFVDNELAWEGVEKGVLRSPNSQAARIELLRRLKAQYADLSAFNAAWELSLSQWEDLKEPPHYTAAAKADMAAFFHDFAITYFGAINKAIKRHAPKQLYLGCRFANAPKEAVRACAEVADVVCYNLYYEYIEPERWTGEEALGKPIIIGEFHFGALDRGMFHTGLVAAKSQAERAKKYQRYVRSVLDHPAFVGCHWFQFADEPTTGRWYDGENYNIGFVDVTDTPYPALVEAAQAVHAEAYARRYGKTP